MGDIRISAVTGDPFILFRGSGNNITDIQLDVLTDYQSANGSGTSLVFNGTEGQLFAITDNLSSGVIYSVSDIGGLPLLEIDASGDVRIAEYGRYVGIGTGEPEYQLDVYGTGKFHSGVMFPDGNIQTIAYTGGASSYSWDVQVTGVSETINSSDTVTFTGDGNTSVTFDPSTNTITISGSGGGGSAYTAGSGLALDSTEFYLNGTGTLSNLLFAESGFIRVGDNAGDNISGVDSFSPNMIAIGNNSLRDYGTNSSAVIPPVAIGYLAMSGASPALSYAGDVAIGYRSLTKGINCAENVSIGIDTLREAIDCRLNVAIGRSTAEYMNSVEHSIAIGERAMFESKFSYSNIAIGEGALSTTEGSHNIAIGYRASAGYENFLPAYLNIRENISIGHFAGYAGYAAYSNPSFLSEYNIYIGTAAGYQINGTGNIVIGSTNSYYSNTILPSNSSNKLEIAFSIVGDTSSKKFAIGAVDSTHVNPDSTLQVVGSSSSTIGLIIDGAASQSEDLTQWRDSSNNVLSIVDNDGNFGIQKTSTSYQLDVAGTGNFESGVRYPDGEVQTVAYKGSSKSIVTITANHSASITEDFILADASSSDITITLPNVSIASGHPFSIKKIDSSINDITITGDANIDGQASASINYQYESVYLVTDGNEWYKM